MKRLIAVSMACLLFAGCTDDESMEQSETSSGVSALASLLATQSDDGTFLSVEARLAVVAGGAFVEDVTDVTLTLDDEVIALTNQTVRLGDGSQTQWYQASTQSSPELTYTPGATARFDFVVQSLRKRYATTMVLPEAASVTAATQPAVDTDLEIVANGSFDGALLRVTRPDTMEDTYTSYPYKAEHVSAVSELLMTNQLQTVSAGVVTVPGSAFSRRGTYEVDLFGLTLEQGGENLGSDSVTLGGVARPLRVDIN